MIRPSVSAAPPAAKGATILTGLVGQLCARVLVGPASAALPIPMSTSRRRMARPLVESQRFVLNRWICICARNGTSGCAPIFMIAGRSSLISASRWSGGSRNLSA